MGNNFLRYNNGKHLYFGAVAGWVLLVLCSFSWNSWNSWQGILEQTRLEGQMSLKKDLSYRAWSAMRGGVYVPVSKDTPANPYLKVDRRTVTTTDGQKLALVNPAYMSRQVSELSKELYGLVSHITSLKYFNPKNAPDNWERKVLLSLQPGNRTDVAELSKINGEYYMRLMHPMVVKPSCLQCHGEQGYKVGDIRGGLSLSMPFSRHLTALKKTIILLALVHACFLFLGVWIIRMFQDKSKCQKSRQELENNQEQLLTLINSTPDCILFKDGEGRWLESNSANLELFHLADYDYKGKKDSELADHTHPIFKQAFLSCEQTDNAAWEKGESSHCIEVIPKPSGGENVYDVVKVPVFNPDGSRKGLIIFARDITEQKKLQDKLVKAEKMEAIGLMAGGVAHDLNNILSGIVSYPELMLMKLPKDSEHREMLMNIQESGIRAADVVADLLTVARGVAAPRKLEHLNDIITNYLESPELVKLQSLHPEVNFQTDLDEKLLHFSCSEVHIRKCLMNLATNASEAITGKGVVTFITENKYIDRDTIGPKNTDIDMYVVLRVSDTGSGIGVEDQAHVFEPFYSKKIMGKSGTGLGLAVVENTIHDHHGMVTVTSDHEGTVFELCFPASDEVFVEDHTDVDVEKLKGSGQLILVVDDEDQPRNIATQMLESLDYKVKKLGSGEEAVEWLSKNKADLILLDMIMSPGMDGCQTYKKIIDNHPEQKAVVVSGYVTEGAIREVRRLGVEQFVKKPYGQVALGRAVKKVLAA